MNCDRLMQVEGLRLNIGGKQVKPGWKILNIQPGPNVDYVGTCVDLSRFDDGSVAEIYASHVLEHLRYRDELPKTLSEFRRVLCRGGVLRLSVPDIAILARMFIDAGLTLPERFHVMRVMFGSENDPFDEHKTGFNWEILVSYLIRARFVNIRRVERFGLFGDASDYRIRNVPISLNVSADKQ